MIAANDPVLAPTPAELELIAYLDGELDEKRVAAVEQRLESDPEYRAQLRAITALGDFIRDDAERIYGKSYVDTIADDVMATLQRQSALPPSSMLPATSRVTRTRKNSVIWIAFGSVAAAAAALFIYVRQNDSTPKPTAQAPTVTAPAQTVASKVKSPPIDTSTVPVAPSENLGECAGVEDLEVGEGATVIYSAAGAAPPVVWIQEKTPKP